MLVLTRKLNESVVIADNIEVKVLEIKGDYVRLGIVAPKEVSIYRQELYEKIKEINLVSVKKKEEKIKNPLKSEKGGENRT